MNWFTLSIMICVGAFLPLFAQDSADEQVDDNAPITGGITYNPRLDENEKARDPFKSPFELEQEQQDQTGVNAGIPNQQNRLPQSIGELDLKGIYLDAKTGYWAIFDIGGDYKWYQVGVLFRDADLVNITDNAVVFKHYTSEDSDHVREVVKELHRGEE
ncbi:hypothetical protein SCOR_21355 [Sulfidibacter corallicola]|uniref:Uncharacterized protein n=1 Tax=Sulfidibacter corallicola TaxID=2818388 RepID=A0A8A4TUI4_SULCO|nr:hypothetical protein [Sulfidibacter corallicola]QTD53017.1 hypothetical protein J3U87_11190 [Sulfidibacter corallicola]